MSVIERSIGAHGSREVGGPRAVVVVLALLIGLLSGFGLGRVETTRVPVVGTEPCGVQRPGDPGTGPRAPTPAGPVDGERAMSARSGITRPLLLLVSATLILGLGIARAFDRRDGPVGPVGAHDHRTFDDR